MGIIARVSEEARTKEGAGAVQRRQSTLPEEGGVIANSGTYVQGTPRRAGEQHLRRRTRHAVIRARARTHTETERDAYTTEHAYHAHFR